MKTIACLFALLLLSAPAWAGERDAYWNAYHQCIAKCGKDDKPCENKCAKMLSEKDRNAVGVMKTCLDIHRESPYAYESCKDHLATKVTVSPRGDLSYQFSVPAIDYYATFPKRYEHKIVPEAELEAWLNQGWEKVDVYTIKVPNRDPHGQIDFSDHPVNRAIIRRAKPD